MNTTLQKYNNLCAANIINSANYDINKKIDLFVEQINEQLDKCGREAGEAFGLSEETINKLNQRTII